MSRYDITRGQFLEFVKNADTGVLDVEPTGSRNNLHWHIGHVLVVTEMFLFNYPKGSNNIPESYNELFKTGSKPADWSGNEPSVSELTNHLEQQLERINALTDDDLAKEIPFTFGDFKTYGELYELAIHHEAEHLGQMKAMKRTAEAES